MQGQFAGKNGSGASNKVAVKWEFAANEQTGLFAVWAHSKQNLGRVNSFEDLHLPLAAIGLLSAKAWNYSIERGLRICLEHSSYLFRRLAFFENYPEERPQKSCSFYFPTEFSGNVGRWTWFLFPRPAYSVSCQGSASKWSCGALCGEFILVNTWKTVELSQKVY